MKSRTRAKPSSKRRAIGEGTFSIQRILVPIDFSDHSKNTLRYAVSFAKQFGSELILVYVVERMTYPADFSFGQVVLPDNENELRERGEQVLQELAASVTAQAVLARTIVRTGKAFLEIVDVAEEEEVDLIIMATHGHTGVEHIIFGGTAERVLRKAACPVLMLKPVEYENNPAR